jgi:hypothetical protein
VLRLHLRRTWYADPPVDPALCHASQSSTDFNPEFSSQLKGYENVLCQCHNCVSCIPRAIASSSLTNFQGNWSARVIKRNPWFTFCFVPVLPLSVHGYEDVICSICNFAQPLQNRQDVMAQVNGGGVPLQHQPPPGGGQGWGGGPPGGGGGQPKPQQNMQVYR